MPDADITLMMFGVLSHIPYQASRREVLSMLAEKTKGPLLISVPTPKAHAETLEQYDTLRQNGSDVGLAREANDVYYTRTNEEEEGEASHLYYHLYDKADLERDLKASGLEEAQIGVSTVENEACLRAARQWPNIRDKRDRYDANQARKLSNDTDFDLKCDYMWAEALGPKAIEAGYRLADLAPLDAVHPEIGGSVFAR